MKKILLGTFAMFAIVTLKANADHLSHASSVARLDYETRELVREVQFVPLNYAVKNMVFRFQQDVENLVRCVRYAGFPVEGVGVPFRCDRELQVSKASFRQVERYLRDTYYDFPRVYQAYQDVARVINSLQCHTPGPGPGPVPGPIFTQYRCQANDAGFEEHGGGHLGFSNRIEQAQRIALNECQRFHGRCRIIRCDRVQ